QALVKQLGVGEEERRIPAEQHQAGYEPRTRIAFDVVVAADAVDSAQHRVVRSPAVPQKFDDRDDDRQADAWNRSERSNANEADDRQPELPALDAETAGQVFQEIGSQQQQQGNGQGANHAG